MATSNSHATKIATSPDADGDPDADVTQLLKRPPHISLSILIFAVYAFIFFEALGTAADRLSGAAQPSDMLIRSLHHLCGIYTIELLLAACCRWCVMAGGWTLSEIGTHHGLYVVAVLLNLQMPAATATWADALIVSLLTAANEAGLVLVASGAPKWFASCRRLYGFSIVLLLLFAELRCYVRAMRLLLAGGSSSWATLLLHRRAEMVVTNLPLLAVCYHADLLRIYCKRWSRQLRVALHSHTQ